MRWLPPAAAVRERYGLGNSRDRSLTRPPGPTARLVQSIRSAYPPVARSDLMRSRTVLVHFALAMIVCAHRAQAQVPAATTDMLRRIFASRDFAPERFGPARWIENGAAYTTVEPSEAASGASDIVRYETATGARSVYASAKALVPTGASEPLDIDDYSWSPDGNLLLVFTNSRRVWRANT